MPTDYAALAEQARREASGLLTPGNVDLTTRPRVKNPDGSISTVRSMSVNIDGKEVLIPTVVGNRVVSDAEAIANYKRTGQHLGMFDTPEHATAFAQQLHESEAQKLKAPAVDYAALAAKARGETAAAPAAAPTTPGRTWTDTAVDLLPAAGGVVGGVVGSLGGSVLGMGVGGVPGAVGGATLGGGAGEAAKQLVNRMRGASAPASAGEAATQIGVQGGVQGAGELVGAGLVGAAGKASPWLMNRALNLTDRLSREFPQLSSTMIEKALTVTQGGLAQARQLLSTAKSEANAALQTAHAAGATVPITAATDGLHTTLAKVMQSADVEGGLATLASVERKIGAGRAAALTPMEADALKTSLQTQSKALYLASKMGQGPPNVTIKAHALADMAASLNNAIGDVTTKAGAAGYRAANADAAEAIGAVRGITKGIRPGANLYQAMVRPGVGAVLGGVGGAEVGGTKGAALGALTVGALTSPAGMSRAAIALSKPGVKIILRGAPKLAAAVASYLANPTPEEGQ